MSGEHIDIVAASPEHAQRLADALGGDFRTEVLSSSEAVVRVTPDSETAARLVSLFTSIGTWLTDAGRASCDVRFGERSLTVLAPRPGDDPDPTEFLIERTRQLETALSSRVVIEQAKGVLAERHGTGVDEAFQRLRQASRSARRNIHELAAEVVAGEAQV